MHSFHQLIPCATDQWLVQISLSLYKLPCVSSSCESITMPDKCICGTPHFHWPEHENQYVPPTIHQVIESFGV